MKLRTIAFFFLTLTLSAAAQGPHGSTPPKRGATAAFHFPPVRSYTLPNGLTVMVVRKPNVPLVEMQLLLDAGSKKESRAEAGLASLTCQMLFTGSKNTQMQDLIAQLDRLNVTMFSTANYDYALVYAKCLTAYSRQAVDLLADVVMNPVFPESYLDFYRNQQKSALEGQFRDPAQTSSILFFTQLFGSGHPYGRSAGGYLDVLDSIRIADVRRFHDAYYRPNNATLQVSGDIDPDALFKLVSDRFENWENRPVAHPEQPAFPVPDSLRILLVQDTAASAAHVRLGNISVMRNAPQFAAALAMNQIFGADFLSRLNMNLWGNKKITPSFRTVLGAHPDVGFIVASGACPPERTAEVVETILAEMNGMMKRKPSTAELGYAKKVCTKSYALEFETNNQILRKMQESLLYGFPLERHERFPAEIAALTPDDIAAAAQMYLDPNRATIVVTGNAAQIYDPLAKKFPHRVRVLDADAAPEGGEQK